MDVKCLQQYHLKRHLFIEVDLSFFVACDEHLWDGKPSSDQYSYGTWEQN